MSKSSLNRDREKRTLERTGDNVTFADLVDFGEVSFSSLIDEPKERRGTRQTEWDSDDGQGRLKGTSRDAQSARDTRQRRQNGSESVYHASNGQNHQNTSKTPQKPSEASRRARRAIRGTQVRPTELNGAYDMFGDARDRIYQGLIVTAVGVLPYFTLIGVFPNVVARLTASPGILDIVMVLALSVILSVIGARLTLLFRCGLWRSLTTARTPSTKSKGRGGRRHGRRHKEGHFVTIDE